MAATVSAAASLFGGGQSKSFVAKKQLSYPLYGADFDPLNQHFLLVGGGGGSSSTGVPNRITLLDVSNQIEIKEVSDINLAYDEDSVTSLAVADSDVHSLLAYAGINGSERDQKAGKNEHFRSFRVPLPQRRKRDVPAEELHTSVVDKTEPLAKTAIFRSATGPKNECYQRVLRVSPPVVAGEGLEKSATRLKPRLTTIASASATQNEIITFPVEEKPSSRTAVSRINLEKKEAGDADIINVDDTATPYSLAYCTDYALFLQQLSGKGVSSSEPVQVYETQNGPVGRSRIRALRWLNTRYLLLVLNRHNRSGVELMIFKVSKDYAQAQQVIVKYVKHMKQATGLDTCTLSADKDGSQQFVIALSGQDSSVQISTVDFVPGTGITSFRQYADYVEVHNGPITRIVFSKFIAPSSQTKTPSTQTIRLATVGIDKNVCIQTLLLQPVPASDPNNSPRYVLNPLIQMGSLVYGLFASLLYLLLAVSAVISFLEFRGAIPPIIGATKYLPQRFHDRYGRPYPGWIHQQPGPVIAESMPAAQSVIDRIKMSEATPVIEKLEELKDRIELAAATPIIEAMEEMHTSFPSPDQIKSSVPSVEQVKLAIPSVEQVQDTLTGLLSQREDDEEHKDKAVIIRDLEHIGGEVSAELRHEAEIVKEGLKKWEHLAEPDRKKWKAKLKEAGQWTEKQGETVLKGVFFGQIGGLVAAAVRGG